MFLSLAIPFFSMAIQDTKSGISFVTASDDTIQTNIDENSRIDIGMKVVHFLFASEADDLNNSILSFSPYESTIITFIVRSTTFYTSIFTADYQRYFSA